MIVVAVVVAWLVGSVPIAIVCGAVLRQCAARDLGAELERGALLLRLADADAAHARERDNLTRTLIGISQSGPQVMAMRHARPDLNEPLSGREALKRQAEASAAALSQYDDVSDGRVRANGETVVPVGMGG